MMGSRVLGRAHLFGGTLLTIALLSSKSIVFGAKMVRLCIASVDPSRLSSQCVMCDRRDFPLSAISCTGINKMNDLIANPLSVEQATCLIYNCRKKIPYIKPEPYHGSVSQAARLNPHTSGSNHYQVPGYPAFYGGFPSPVPYPSLSNTYQMQPSSFNFGPNSIMSTRDQHLPYTMMSPMQISPLGFKKYRLPLFKRSGRRD